MPRNASISAISASVCGTNGALTNSSFPCGLRRPVARTGPTRPPRRRRPAGRWKGGFTTDGRHSPSAQCDVDLGADADLRRQEGERDPPLQHGREVAARDLARDLAADEDGVLGARRPASLGEQASQGAATARTALGFQRLAATEGALVPADHPPEARLQRSDARPELVAVEGQAGFETERVAGAESRPAGRRRRRRHARIRPQRLDRHGALDAVLAGVARCRRPGTATRRTRNRRPRSAPPPPPRAPRSRAAPSPVVPARR